MCLFLLRVFLLGFAPEKLLLYMLVQATYYVYIITNKNNSVLYIGVTNSIRRRVYEHKIKHNRNS
ncbi:MAG: GIY-YIG nuclease family protein, partial [Chitinophagales bacterium]|nr:GIY-YIG nuclease family protein [Chitinophagales bacterium]